MKQTTKQLSGKIEAAQPPAKPGTHNSELIQERIPEGCRARRSRSACGARSAKRLDGRRSWEAAAATHLRYGPHTQQDAHVAAFRVAHWRGWMVVVAVLPVRDGVGNVLVDVFFAAESDLVTFERRLPMPASLVVVRLEDPVLMIFDGWREQWELPGGMREGGETARQAAARELAEETGIDTTDLDFVAVAEFDLRLPSRREYAAVYRTDLQTAPQLVANDEALAFWWWDPHSWPTEQMSPLDAEIARLAIQTPSQ
jgi:8-oxo-dGTP diphosphatase